MSSKVAGATHDKLKEKIGPIHEEIGRLSMEIERLHGERAILQTMAISELEGIGISKEAVGNLAAACW
jgi:hypothetical protein